MKGTNNNKEIVIQIPTGNIKLTRTGLRLKRKRCKHCGEKIFLANFMSGKFRKRISPIEGNKFIEHKLVCFPKKNKEKYDNTKKNTAK